MAVPFNVPDEEESTSPQQSSSAQTSAPVTPTRPMSIPIQNRNSHSSSASSSTQSSPQHSPLDNEMLVQAFYEALCRCSQMNTPTSPSNSFNQGHFWYPPSASASHSNASSPRNSFRSFQRRRLNSYGSQSQYSQYSEDYSHEHELSNWEQHYQQREELEEFSGQIQQKVGAHEKTEKKKSKKDQNKSNKITNFVISALQFVIDTLK